MKGFDLMIIEPEVKEYEIRKYECPLCTNKFWVDCDDTDYPDYCPFCGKEIPQDKFIKSQSTNEIAE